MGDFASSRMLGADRCHTMFRSLSSLGESIVAGVEVFSFLWWWSTIGYQVLLLSVPSICLLTSPSCWAISRTSETDAVHPETVT